MLWWMSTGGRELSMVWKRAHEVSLAIRLSSWELASCLSNMKTVLLLYISIFQVQITPAETNRQYVPELLVPVLQMDVVLDASFFVHFFRLDNVQIFYWSRKYSAIEPLLLHKHFTQITLRTNRIRGMF